MIESPSMEMPRYKCHKTVWALKIVDILVKTDIGVILYPEDKRYAPLEKNWEFVKKHMQGERSMGAPCYYVQYADGYASLSPVEAFEDGYTPETVTA